VHRRGAPYLWAQTWVDSSSGEEVVVSDQPTISPPITESVKYRLEMYDPFGASHSDEVTINAADTKLPPTVDFSIVEFPSGLGRRGMVDGIASSDPEGSPLTYKWALMGVPAGSTSVLERPLPHVAQFFPDLPGLSVVELRED
jgi:hypothetical protein